MTKKIYIYGKHAVREALEHAPHALERIFLAFRDDDAKELRNIGTAAKIPVANFDPRTPPHGVEVDAIHQGVVGIIVPERLVLPYHDFIENLPLTPDTALAILGEIQDPQNVGAIIRSAAAFGISGILVPERREAPITGAVVKVSAGMAFRMPLVSIGNINATVRDLKEKGFWIYGLASEGATNIGDENFGAPSVFILGNESKGIREKTRDLCDVLLSIPLHPQCESLNVAASGSVAFYAWSAKHPSALKKS